MESTHGTGSPYYSPEQRTADEGTVLKRLGDLTRMHQGAPSSYSIIRTAYLAAITDVQAMFVSADTGALLDDVLAAIVDHEATMRIVQPHDLDGALRSFGRWRGLNAAAEAIRP